MRLSREREGESQRLSELSEANGNEIGKQHRPSKCLGKGQMDSPLSRQEI